MARLLCLALPGKAHGISQRGNRLEQTCFEEPDYALYIDLLADAANRACVEIWSHCAITNHVHIVAVPSDLDGLPRTFRFVHRHSTGCIDARQRVTGHLWQGHFISVTMDDQYLVAALLYAAQILDPAEGLLDEMPTPVALLIVAYGALAIAPAWYVGRSVPRTARTRPHGSESVQGGIAAWGPIPAAAIAP